MKNRLTDLFERKQNNVLNIYFTAGHPTLESTVNIITTLASNGADIIELGMPYSDPMADGETIQKSSALALKNGMTLDTLFAQVEQARKTVQIPLIVMGYYNQLIQYGIERFVARCEEVGIDGMIIPDLPMTIYEKDHKALFEQHNISHSFLITPQTSEDRIRQADELSSGFIYVVSQSSITGKTGDINQEQEAYFERINKMDLKTPKLIGFGIHDKVTKERAFSYANGAIIGSAFIRAIDGSNRKIDSTIQEFLEGVIG
jgi:tryptophan synthase alpha chain